MNRKILKAFGGKLIGSKRRKFFVVTTVEKMPQDIIDFLTHTTWFVSSMEDAWGFTFTGNDLKNQHLIFLSDELFYESANQIRFTIAHEIGHVILRHRNSIFSMQSKKEVEFQEKQADKFAEKYFPKP